MIRHLYFHIPFCPKLCPYCSFYVETGAKNKTTRFLEALLRHVESAGDAHELRPETIYFGGGTPSALTCQQLEYLLGGLRERLDLRAMREWTFEVNPATVRADKAKVLRDDVLYAVRQKHQDLLTQLAVSIQGYLAIDLVRKNNLELIKGVDRATTTTISALRTAVIVAQALANQKLVLDQITALNTTTANLIESTSQLLATQGVAIQRQSAEATIGIQSLQRSFDNVYQAMDSIDTFKVAALDSMKQTIGTLQGEIDKAQSYLTRVRVSDGKSTSGNDLNLSL